MWGSACSTHHGRCMRSMLDSAALQVMRHFQSSLFAGNAPFSVQLHWTQRCWVVDTRSRIMLEICSTSCPAAHLHIPHEALQQGTTTIRQHCGWHTLPGQVTLQAQPVSSPCMVRPDQPCMLRCIQVGVVSMRSLLLAEGMYLLSTPLCQGASSSGHLFWLNHSAVLHGSTTQLCCMVWLLDLKGWQLATGGRQPAGHGYSPPSG